jgi:Lon protease-like protein
MSSEATSAGSNIVPIPEVLPIFPLPNVVFFPYTYLPLHIFEPRYREMVENAASTEECIGMALLKDGWEDYDHDTPPIFELGCVGQLVSVNPLSDGRYNIVLKGLRRCTYQEQTVDTSYRQAKVNLLSSQEGEELDMTLRGTLMESAERYLELDFTSVEKHFLLESENLLQHARRLTDLIRFKLPNLQSPAQG